jgi:hypothetical protein
MIALSFEVAMEDQVEFFRKMEEFKQYWDDNGFVFSQFRDATRKSRVMQLFLTEKSVDDFTALIQSDSQAKAMFEGVKAVAGSVVVSCMERVV